MDLKSRYVAAMVLSGVGDAMGYKNGAWEFCHSGPRIHAEAIALGGVENLEVSLPGWRVSDDTVMHLATAEALGTHETGEDKEKLYARIAKQYKLGIRDMAGRAPGDNTMGGCSRMRPDEEKGYCTPFNSGAVTCGAAMRAMCIGLRYPRPEELDDLIAISVESGRMTHHHPTGYLGSMAAALFTAYSIQGRPLKSWGVGLVKEAVPRALDYIRKRGDYVEQNERAWDYFGRKWEEYLETRGIADGISEPQFPEAYGVVERDAFYDSLSDRGWGGDSGHDAPMIAYDALLGSKGDWKELCLRGILHYGDNDSTGVIAACCYGAMFGFQGVPECNYKDLEYVGRLKKSASRIYSLSHPDPNDADTRASDEVESIPPLPRVPTNYDLEQPGGEESSQGHGADQTNMDAEANPEAAPSEEELQTRLETLQDV